MKKRTGIIVAFATLLLLFVASHTKQTEQSTASRIKAFTEERAFPSSSVVAPVQVMHVMKVEKNYANAAFIDGSGTALLEASPTHTSTNLTPVTQWKSSVNVATCVVTAILKMQISMKTASGGTVSS